ncbi:MAG: glycosyltransferase family 2 protein [Bacteroidetes bacterium]|nr:glycosyltransferase family 2 protein [Bacteroidota bacterium]
MSGAKVSVIIPVYNTELYLNKCLDSVINQTLKEIEIICINDGSKDSSLDILKAYAKKDDRIIIIDKKNGGQGLARNIAIKKATGEYLGFVDSDDWIAHDMFEKMYSSAKILQRMLLFASLNYTIRKLRKYDFLNGQKFNLIAATMKSRFIGRRILPVLCS